MSSSTSEPGRIETGRGGAAARINFRSVRRAVFPVLAGPKLDGLQWHGGGTSESRGTLPRPLDELERLADRRRVDADGDGLARLERAGLAVLLREAPRGERVAQR